MREGIIKRTLAVLSVVFFCTAGWISARSVQLSPQERFWLDERGGVVRFASGENRPPFEFVRESGASSGMAVDLGLKMAEAVGYKAEFYHMTLKEARATILSGQYDAVTCLFYSSERARDFGFTPVVFRVPAFIFVPVSSAQIKSLTDLNGKTVAIPEQDYAEE